MVKETISPISISKSILVELFINFLAKATIRYKYVGTYLSTWLELRAIVIRKAHSKSPIAIINTGQVRVGFGQQGFRTFYVFASLLYGCPLKYYFILFFSFCCYSGNRNTYIICENFICLYHGLWNTARTDRQTDGQSSGGLEIGFLTLKYRTLNTTYLYYKFDIKRAM